jgi:hypothetical protein
MELGMGRFGFFVDVFSNSPPSQLLHCRQFLRTFQQPFPIPLSGGGSTQKQTAVFPDECFEGSFGQPSGERKAWIYQQKLKIHQNMWK